MIFIRSFFENDGVLGHNQKSMSNPQAFIQKLALIVVVLLLVIVIV
jgi:hypothetical protein